MESSVLTRYLAECRELVLAEIREIIPDNRYRAILYDLMLDYPLRPGKGFRPSLCIATCRALGGRLEDVLRSAAVLELYHNAFLLHDDVEDGSLLRRGQPTLHREYGVPIAVNVGDAMNALCLQPLLDNMSILGMGKALRILQLIAHMARESVEGQALELDWVRRKQWNLRDRDYCLMTYKKTGWYTFIAPMQIGALVTDAQAAQLALLRKYASYVGVAFQIQDDLLNLQADQTRYGKEIGGDLWEGKRTLVLLHMLRMVKRTLQVRAQCILDKPRDDKTEDDIALLHDLIERTGSLDYARQVARQLAAKGKHILGRAGDWMPPSIHRDFILEMAEHVIAREW